MKIPAQSKAADLLDRALDWSVAPGYSKVGYEVRERLWGREMLELEGKTAIVTGATSGIGEAACVGMARAGAEVHLVVRNLEKGEEARERVAAAAGVDGDQLSLHRCDLSSLASVRSFASGFLRAHPKLDVLVNNAGVLPPERTHTDEGFELTFATNVLGPFLLTAKLLPALRAAAPARVIDVSSGGMLAAKLDVDDPQLEGRDFNGTRYYAHTKRAEVVLGDEWARRLAPDVQVFSMHPGWVATPGLAESLPGLRPVGEAAAPGSRRGCRHDRLARRLGAVVRPERRLLARPPPPPGVPGAEHPRDRGGARAILRRVREARRG